MQGGAEALCAGTGLVAFTALDTTSVSPPSRKREGHSDPDALRLLTQSVAIWVDMKSLALSVSSRDPGLVRSVSDACTTTVDSNPLPRRWWAEPPEHPKTINVMRDIVMMAMHSCAMIIV